MKSWLLQLLACLGYAGLTVGIGLIVVLGITALAATVHARRCDCAPARAGRCEHTPRSFLTRVNHTGEAFPSGPHGVEGRPYGSAPSYGAAVPARTPDGAPASCPGPGRRHPDDGPAT